MRRLALRVGKTEEGVNIVRDPVVEEVKSPLIPSENLTTINIITTNYIDRNDRPDHHIFLSQFLLDMASPITAMAVGPDHILGGIVSK